MSRLVDIFKTKNKRRLKRTAKVDLRIPVHLAVIMDGNGRWARKRGLPRTAGHRAGAENLENVCEACIEQGIQYLTVYAFSTENWSRPTEEIDTLMDLFIEFIHRFDTKMAREGIRLRFSGDLAGLPAHLQSTISHAEENSRHRDRLQLIIALNYGGRRELAQACRKLAEQVRSGKIEPDTIDENLVRSALYLPDVPDPDLIIRPSGEQRLSNFLIWQSAYSEFWFSDVLWPDFNREHLLAALEAYTMRDRRFGGLKQI
ncbi:MAG: isoprenyl transferase [Saccharofermentanales bacterium]|jgi:undecaprenyl diphosphate synthase|nr:isoprenyl transferase [Clostridiaceae bacterium]